MRLGLQRWSWPLAVGCWRAGPAAAAETIVLASTTSVENSGLLAHILPEFTNKTGISVRVLAQGTGQALATAARGDADLVLVHDPEAEQQFIAEGHGAERRQIAWNDFIVVGPRADPAHIAGGQDAVAAFTAIADAGAPFVSRGDKSGTDALEHRLWQAAEIDPAKPAAAHGTATSAAAWGRRSTRLRRWAPTPSPIAAPGSVSATSATSRCSSKAIRGC